MCKGDGPIIHHNLRPESEKEVGENERESQPPLPALIARIALINRTANQAGSLLELGLAEKTERQGKKRRDSISCLGSSIVPSQLS